MEDADDAAGRAVDRYQPFEWAVASVGGQLEPLFQRPSRTNGILVSANDGED